MPKANSCPAAAGAAGAGPGRKRQRLTSRPLTSWGKYTTDDTFLAEHIAAILALPLVDVAGHQGHEFPGEWWTP
ncbi:MAG: hypothetical protein WKG07_11240 [Hymenobacter sp.]